MHKFHDDASSIAAVQVYKSHPPGNSLEAALTQIVRGVNGGSKSDSPASGRACRGVRVRARFALRCAFGEGVCGHEPVARRRSCAQCSKCTLGAPYRLWHRHAPALRARLARAETLRWELLPPCLRHPIMLTSPEVLSGVVAAGLYAGTLGADFCYDDRWVWKRRDEKLESQSCPFSKFILCRAQLLLF